MPYLILLPLRCSHLSRAASRRGKCVLSFLIPFSSLRDPCCPSWCKLFPSPLFHPSAQPSITPGREAVVSICLGWARLLFINISAFPTGTLPSSLTAHPVCSFPLSLFPSRLFVLYLFCLPIPQLDNSIPFRYYYLPVPRPLLIIYGEN